VTCPLGCCEGNSCKTGNDPAACGTNGAACKKCGSFETCSYGTCNDSWLCDSSNCSSGCCKDSQCESGTTDEACGSAGAVCHSCPPYMTCVSQKCEIKPTSKWKVTVVEVKVDSQKQYDPTPFADPAPDLYVELKVGSQTKKTQTISNKYDAVFNEYVLTATAQDLMGTIQITIYDYDPLDPDDQIALCTTTIFKFELEKGEANIYYCGSSPDLKQITLSFVPELTP
jgi:hypothetical protein